MAYGCVHCTLWSGDDGSAEIRSAKPCAPASSFATTLGAVALVWRVVPGEYLGVAWLGLAVLMLEAGLRDLPA